MKIVIETIPASEHRGMPLVKTSGDWQLLPDGSLLIRVSEMGNKMSEVAVGVHELIEAVLCNNDGITDEQVMAFDAMWEQEWRDGLHKDDDEPGDDPRAIYKKQHEFAMLIERLLINALGMNWKEHNARVCS